MPKLILNNQQDQTVKKGQKWFTSSRKQTFEISGPAGTGKTTIVYAIVDALGLEMKDVLFMAYIGKAVNALTRKGLFAKTIHSSIYDVTLIPKIDDEGEIILNRNGKKILIPSFNLKKYLPEDVKLLVVDEGSTVSKDYALDILSFGLPVIILGDLNQLPPTFGESYFLKKPDILLTEIMRQAKDNPIIHLSQMALRGERIREGQYGPKCFVIPKDKISDKMLVKSDMVLCGRNKTRQKLNQYIRQNILKIDKQYPTIGEKLICRKNNWKETIDGITFLNNGLIGYVEDVFLDTYNKKTINIDFRPEYMTELCFEDLSIDYRFLFASPEEKETFGLTRTNKFEFAYAITTHLAQGSQGKNVFVYNENMPEQKNWNYTAITRAEEGLIYAI